MNIDIYSDNPEITLAYQAAVMQAALEGKPVQCNYSTPECPGHGWWPVTCPGWDWSSHMYRIDPASRPRLAVGHNPDGLTEEQVGVKDGWRLLAREEVVMHYLTRDFTRDIAVWLGAGWSNGAHGHGNTTYRTKKPPGFFIPKTKVRVPLVSDELPPVCWLRYPSDCHDDCLLTHISVYGIRARFCCRSGGWVAKEEWSMKDLMHYGVQFSSDRKTWHPCWKEV